MGSIANLLDQAPEAKEETVEIAGEVFTFFCDAPGEVVSEAFLVPGTELDRLAMHFSAITKHKVSADTVRLAKIVRGTIKGEKPGEIELIRLYLARPMDFLALSAAAQLVLGIDGGGILDPTVQVGAGNSLGAGHLEPVSSPAYSPPLDTIPTTSDGKATQPTNS